MKNNDTFRTIFTFIVSCLLALPMVDAQVEFDPTTLQCDTTTIDITYTDCRDWSGSAVMSIPGSTMGISFPNGDTVDITNGTGSVDIGITPDAPSSFDLAIETVEVDSNPGNCMNVGYVDTITMFVNCDPCESFSAAIDSSQDETCDGACDGEATVDPSGGEQPYGFVWENTSGDTIDTSAMVDSLCDGDYITIVTDDNGCVDTASVTIEAGPAPVTPTFSFDTAYCVDEMPHSLPTTSDNGFEGTWDPSSISTSSAGTTTYTFMPSSGECASVATVDVTVHALPTPSITIEQQESCENECDGEMTVNGSWSSISWSNGAPTSTISGLCAGTYTVTVTDNNGCTETASETIDAGPTPITPMFTFDTEYCVDETADPLPTTSNNGVEGTWNPSSISTNSAGNTTYTFTPSSGECASFATVDVTVNENVTPTFSFDTAYCVDDMPDSLPTTSNNGVEGTWNPSSISTNSAGVTTYTFTPSSGECATEETVDVTVNENVTPTFSFDTAYCVDDMPDVLPGTSSNGVQGTWAPLLINTSSAGETTYTFTPNTGECATEAKVDVTVVPQPTPPQMAIKIPSAPAVCAGDSLTLDSAASGGQRGIHCEIQYRYNDGTGVSSWSSSIPTFESKPGINTIEAKRANCQGGCRETNENTVASWEVENQPVAPTINVEPNELEVCAGIDVSASFGNGSGGVNGMNQYDFRTNSDYQSYDPGQNLSTGSFIDEGGIITFRSIRFSDTTGCLTDTNEQDIEVFSLPQAEFRTEDGGGVEIDEICQNENLYWIFTGSNGKLPYGFQIENGIDTTLFTLGSDAIRLYKISTENPGQGVLILSGISDANGCYREIGQSKSYEVFQNPEAEIGYFWAGRSRPPERIGDRFSINADGSEYYPPASNFESYQWSFSPPVKMITDTKDTSELSEFQGSSDNGFFVNALETNISLEVIDNNGCKNKVIDTLVVEGEDCSLNLTSSETMFCSDQNGQATVNMTFTYTPPGRGNRLSDQTDIIDCDGCNPDPIIEIDGRELSISLEYDNVSSEVDKNIQLKFADTNNQPNDIICDNIKPQEFTLIPKPWISIDNVTYPDADLFCKNGDNIEVHISGIVPKEAKLSYRIISNGVMKDTTISTTDGSLSISLPKSTAGQFDFYLNSLEGSGVLDCETDLSDLESFSYRVEECRKPQLLPLEFPYVDSNTFCLQQGGITIEAFDVNDYREFEGVFEREFNWYLIQNADTINTPSVFRGPKENSVLLYLQSQFVTAGEAEVFCIVKNSYGNGVVFSDTVKHTIYIKAERSPVPRTIYVYPGNVFYLWDTISVADEEYLCIDWGYRSASSNSPTGDTLISNSSDIPGISENRYSLFANNWDKLESIINQDLYLWTDTWVSENGSCENKEYACITRNYFNTELPPDGAPRFRDQADQNVFAIYPNPNAGDFKLNLKGDWLGNYEIAIYDVNGKKWWANTFRKIGFQWSKRFESLNIPPGLYFAVLTNENGTRFHQKIVIH